MRSKSFIAVCLFLVALFAGGAGYLTYMRDEPQTLAERDARAAELAAAEASLR